VHGAGGGDEPRSGSCGPSLTWEYSGGTLRISGSGPMDDYYRFRAPWASVREQIERIDFQGSGPDTVGDNAFFGCAVKELGFDSFYPADAPAIWSVCRSGDGRPAERIHGAENVPDDARTGVPVWRELSCDSGSF
jgi:hypothetical protein